MKKPAQVATVVALLVVLLGMKWLKDHPAFTEEDTQERLLLLRASEVHASILGVAGVKIAPKDWEGMLREFRLVGPISAPYFSGKTVFSATYKQNGRVIGSRYINYDPCTRRARYTKYVDDVGLEMRQLHPTTTRDLERFLNQSTELAQKVTRRWEEEGVSAAACP